MTTRDWRALMLMGVAASLLGCSSNGPKDCPLNRCVDVLRLDLRDPNGTRVVDNVTITSSASSPSFDPVPCAANESCSYSVTAPQGDLVVAATGYQAVTVHYTQETDECGAPISQSIEVTLQPSNASTPATLTRTLSTTCG